MERENLNKIIQLRHELHEHPELSLEETWTKKRLMNFVKENTALEVIDKTSWFYVVKKAKHTKHKPIAFRADFDAVAIQETCELPYVSQNPGIGHKCGHDGHSAVLCGLILELEKVELEHDTYFIFQHAEEIGQGGQDGASLILEKDIEQVFAFHNRSGYKKGALVYRRGLTQCASKGLSIYFTGSPAHASQPEDGINPAYAVAEMIAYTKALLQQNIFQEMVLCTIIHSQIGQKNFGIAASTGEVSMTLRANREQELEEFEDLVRKKAKELAEREKLKVEYEVLDAFPETRNDETAIDKVLKCASQLGMETYEMSQPWRASEDFGYYTKLCSGAMIYIGNGENYPMVHTGDYDFCDDIIPQTVELFKKIAMEQ